MTVPPSLRRAGRILGWSLLGLVLVLFFALAGGMAFLRTQPGERWIADTAVSVLKNVGIEAQIGSLEGPLPFSLHLREVRLADGQGVWLDVPEATLRIGAGALLRGHLLVEDWCPRAVCRVPGSASLRRLRPIPWSCCGPPSCSRWLRTLRGI
ncbi:MAG: hypothetical protein ACLU4B_02610 [Bilophila wadsworthia]